MQSRRVFLSGLAGTGLAFGLAGRAASLPPATAGAPLPDTTAVPPTLAAPQPPTARLGYQLYTARDAMAADMAGTLQQLAEAGYREVEFAGYFDTPPATVKTHLDAAGLTAPSAHVPPDMARLEPQALFETARTLGHEHLVIAWIDEAERRTPAQWEYWAGEFNRFGAACREAGLRFAYHNHDFEFRPLPGLPRGATPMEFLLQSCDPDLVEFELDIYWARKAGYDPRTLLMVYPGRFSLAHFKDMGTEGEMVDIGSGRIDFRRLVEGPGWAPFEHVFVEHDSAADPFAFARNSFTSLQRWMDI